MELKYEIIDNFLNIEEYTNLKNFLHSETIPWFFRESETHTSFEKSKNGFFSFHGFNYGKPDHPEFFQLSLNTLQKLKAYIPLQIRANCTFRDKDSVECDWHTDYYSNFITTAILYFTTCNAKTVLKINNKEIIVDSVENRLLKFTSTIQHKLVYHTDVFKRIVVNYNYITHDGNI